MKIDSILCGLDSRRSVWPGVVHLCDLLLHWFQYLERTNQVLVHTHQRSRIIELSTVIRRRKYRY